jgi:hypothetical protein
VVAGGTTGEGGIVILTGLPEGGYHAFADRPGFETAYYGTPGGGIPMVIQLDEQTPAVLADIRLAPVALELEDPAEEGPVPVTNLYNVPNPFRPHTAIRYRLEEAAAVSVQVFDYRGRLVRTLIEEQSQSAGSQEVPWDGRDADGRRVSSGVYFFRVQAGIHSTSRKMVLLP